MKAFLATLCTLACVGMASANITVTGTGKVVYTPDLATILAGVSSEGKTAAEAWAKNRDIVARIFESLKAAGIDPKDMKTSNLHVSPRYVTKDKQSILVGYTVAYDLSVTVRKLPEMGKVLDGMVDAGANRRMSITFGCSDLDRLTEEARIKAVAEARKKAEIFTTGAGARLGHVVAINDGSWQPPHYRTLQLEYAKDAAPAAALLVAAGEQELSASVTVTYEIDNSVAP